eukprot:3646313-Amphidinium_carterae.1
MFSRDRHARAPKSPSVPAGKVTGAPMYDYVTAGITGGLGLRVSEIMRVPTVIACLSWWFQRFRRNKRLSKKRKIPTMYITADSPCSQPSQESDG